MSSSGWPHSSQFDEGANFILFLNLAVFNPPVLYCRTSLRALASSGVQSRMKALLTFVSAMLTVRAQAW
jgi:hypothetical protein